MSGKEAPTATGGHPNNDKTSARQGQGGSAKGSSGVSQGGSASEKLDQAVKQTRSGDSGNGGKGTATRG